MSSKKLSVWLYSKNQRDFINNDVKVIVTDKYFLFVSKKENYVFREIRYKCLQQEERLTHLEIYMVWDEVFTDIINLRNNDEKI